MPMRRTHARPMTIDLDWAAFDAARGSHPRQPAANPYNSVPISSQASNIIRQEQKAAGLPQTGTLDQATVNAVRSKYNTLSKSGSGGKDAKGKKSDRSESSRDSKYKAEEAKRKAKEAKEEKARKREEAKREAAELAKTRDEGAAKVTKANAIAQAKVIVAQETAAKIANMSGADAIAWAKKQTAKKTKSGKGSIATTGSAIMLSNPITSSQDGPRMSGNLANFKGKKAAPFAKGGGRKKMPTRAQKVAVAKKMSATISAARGVKTPPFATHSMSNDDDGKVRLVDLGKDGSKWGHGYVPENAAAVALKHHRSPGKDSGSDEHYVSPELRPGRLGTMKQRRTESSARAYTDSAHNVYDNSGKQFGSVTKYGGPGMGPTTWGAKLDEDTDSHRGSPFSSKAEAVGALVQQYESRHGALPDADRSYPGGTTKQEFHKLVKAGEAKDIANTARAYGSGSPQHKAKVAEIAQRARDRAKLEKGRGGKKVSLANDNARFRLVDLGEDGAKWKHGFIPENAEAVALKDHKKSGHSKADVLDTSKSAKNLKYKSDAVKKKMTQTELRQHARDHAAAAGRARTAESKAKHVKEAQASLDEIQRRKDERAAKPKVKLSQAQLNDKRGIGGKHDKSGRRITDDKHAVGGSQGMHVSGAERDLSAKELSQEINNAKKYHDAQRLNVLKKELGRRVAEYKVTQKHLSRAQDLIDTKWEDADKNAHTRHQFFNKLRSMLPFMKPQLDKDEHDPSFHPTADKFKEHLSNVWDVLKDELPRIAANHLASALISGTAMAVGSGVAHTVVSALGGG